MYPTSPVLNLSKMNLGFRLGFDQRNGHFIESFCTTVPYHFYLYLKVWLCPTLTHFNLSAGSFESHFSLYVVISVETHSVCWFDFDQPIMACNSVTYCGEEWGLCGDMCVYKWICLDYADYVSPICVCRVFSMVWPCKPLLSILDSVEFSIIHIGYKVIIDLKFSLGFI